MLVLTRKQDEAIQIGEDVTVTVLEIRGGRVRLGIDAPSGVGVHRQEVWADADLQAPSSSTPPAAAGPLAGPILPACQG